MDWQQRKKEIDLIVNYKFGHELWKVDEIITQEKSMIDKERKGAIREIIIKIQPYCYHSKINEILKDDYDIEIENF